MDFAAAFIVIGLVWLFLRQTSKPFNCKDDSWTEHNKKSVGNFIASGKFWRS